MSFFVNQQAVSALSFADEFLIDTGAGDMLMVVIETIKV